MIRQAMILMLAVQTWTVYAQELEDPRGILRDRTARYWAELDITDDEVGVANNPTGHPIGGGDGYRDVVTGGEYAARTYNELKDALERARPGEVVFIPGEAEIDFSGKQALEIPDEVTIASDRGHQGSKGALLYSDELDTDHMLHAKGDYVRITGLRIRGPFAETWRVPIGSDGLGISGFGVEIDNCELSAFSHAAITVQSEASRAYIHHNYIHHNHRQGLGYGTSSSGADILYEANIYDHNRHHIASGGTPGSAYEARYNLCLPNASSHLFDMHGGRDRGDETDIAGDWLHIHHNTFESKRQSVHIRGVASQGAWIHHNWMVNPDSEEMIEADGRLHLYRNAVGPNKKPYAQEGH